MPKIVSELMQICTYSLKIVYAVEYPWCQRYAKANNPQCPDYDYSKPTTYIIYLDAINLYGLAMNQLLPVGLS